MTPLPRSVQILLKRLALIASWLLALGTVALGTAGCGVPPPLEIEYSGCLHTLTPVDAPTCVLDESSPHLKLWVRSSAGLSVTVEAGDQRWESEHAEPIQEGFLFRLKDLDADVLTVHAGDWPASGRQTLKLGRATRPEFNERSLEELEALLEAGVPPHDRGDLLRALTDKCDSFEESSEYLAMAAVAFEEAGQRSSSVSALLVRHFTLYNHLEQPKQAEEQLAALPLVPKGDGWTNFLIAFYQGAWANRNGRYRTALRGLEASIAQSERLDLGQAHYSEQERAHLLSRLGRYSELKELLLWLEAQASTLEKPADLARLFSNMGWSRLLMSEAGHPSDPTPYLERALSEAKASADQDLIFNAELNLAFASIHQNRPGEARLHMARLSEIKAQQPWWIETWAFDIEARLALSEGDADQALRLFSTLAEQPESKFYPDADWRAAVGMGQALAALGRSEEALAAYGRAENELWQVSLAVPLDRGRYTSVNFYRRGTLLHLEFLLQLDRKAEALELVRRSRSRVFQGLVIESRLDTLNADEKDRWHELISRYRKLQDQFHSIFRATETAAADRARMLRESQTSLQNELAEIFDEALSLLDAGKMPALIPPNHEELWLVYHPLSEGWLGLAVDSGGIQIARLPAPTPQLMNDPVAFSQEFLEPFGDAIRQASKIRILPYGEQWNVHFEALPFDGDPLLAKAPIVYGLDLPAREATERTYRALLITDPSGSLSHAPDEVEFVKKRLENDPAPWQIDSLPGKLGSPATVTSALRQLAKGGDIFHFAGHGDLLGSTGQSGLVFEQGFSGKEILSIHDVLTLARAPATVVLSGCETLRRSNLESPTELGVGHAFLLAGSHSAVGAVEKVDDQKAEQLIRLFYREWQGPGSEAGALRRAQLELHRSSVPGWSSFRVLER